MNIDGARRYQSELLYQFFFKKQLKERCYRVFLQERTGYLPDLSMLRRWRKWLAVASVLSMLPMCIGTVISLPWAYSDLIYLSDDLIGFTSPCIICGELFIILGCFSVMFDHVIYKRYPTRSVFGI